MAVRCERRREYCRFSLRSTSLALAPPQPKILTFEGVCAMSLRLGCPCVSFSNSHCQQTCSLNLRPPRRRHAIHSRYQHCPVLTLVTLRGRPCPLWTTNWSGQAVGTWTTNLSATLAARLLSRTTNLPSVALVTSIAKHSFGLIRTGRRGWSRPRL